MKDVSCLADGLVVSTDPSITGINANEMIVGPTGCGKSVSNAYSRILHTFDSSVVVPINKKAIKERFTDLLQSRGYEVYDLNFACPEKSTVGFDPMHFIHKDEDVVETARSLIEAGEDQFGRGKLDAYWNDSATSVLSAEIGLVRLNAMYEGKEASFADVIDLHRSIVVNPLEPLTYTNIDALFDKADEIYPGNQASQMWRTIRGLAQVTSSCIFSMVNNAYDKIFPPSVIELMKKPKQVDFKRLGTTKCALFITSSPVNKSLDRFVNLMYSDMFRELFDYAESREDSRLPVPIHIICDDFACGSKIRSFADYISIFRASGISVSLLVQSESQMEDMYGRAAATSILNNVDTYIYMGGMDSTTIHNIAYRFDKPFVEIQSLPLEQVLVFRRGSEPIKARRYQLFDDPLYKEMMHS